MQQYDSQVIDNIIRTLKESPNDFIWGILYFKPSKRSVKDELSNNNFTSTFSSKDYKKIRKILKKLSNNSIEYICIVAECSLKHPFKAINADLYKRIMENISNFFD